MNAPHYEVTLIERDGTYLGTCELEISQAARVAMEIDGPDVIMFSDQLFVRKDDHTYVRAKVLVVDSIRK